MNTNRRDQLITNMIVCNFTVRNLLDKIYALEADTESSVDDKFCEIKKIREEITKVGAEIDNIKKEITLLKTHTIN